MKDKYAVYFRWIEDNEEDSFNVTSYKDLAKNLENIKKRKDVELIEVLQITRCCEYVPYDIPKKYK